MSQKNIGYYYDSAYSGYSKIRNVSNHSKTSNKQTRRADLSSLEFFLLIAVIFVGSIITLRTFCLVKAKSNETIALQEKLKTIKSENMVLEEEISKKFDLSTVKEVAEKRLGMHQPFSYQVIKIKSPKVNYVIKYKR